MDREVFFPFVSSQLYLIVLKILMQNESNLNNINAWSYRWESEMDVKGDRSEWIED